MPFLWLYNLVLVKQRVVRLNVDPHLIFNLGLKLCGLINQLYKHFFRIKLNIDLLELEAIFIIFKFRLEKEFAKNKSICKLLTNLLEIVKMPFSSNI